MSFKSYLKEVEEMPDGAMVTHPIYGTPIAPLNRDFWEFFDMHQDDADGEYHNEQLNKRIQFMLHQMLQRQVQNDELKNKAKWANLVKTEWYKIQGQLENYYAKMSPMNTQRLKRIIYRATGVKL